MPGSTHRPRGLALDGRHELLEPHQLLLLLIREPLQRDRLQLLDGVVVDPHHESCGHQRELPHLHEEEDTLKAGLVVALPLGTLDALLNPHRCGRLEVGNVGEGLYPQFAHCLYVHLQGVPEPLGEELGGGHARAVELVQAQADATALTVDGPLADPQLVRDVVDRTAVDDQHQEDLPLVVSHRAAEAAPLGRIDLDLRIDLHPSIRQGRLDLPDTLRRGSATLRDSLSSR